jgi:restriction endonuclease S subunit
VKTGWQVCALDDIASIESGYAFKSSDYADSGHFLVRIANVQDGYITWEKPRYVPLTDRTIRYELCPGDIVVSLTGDVGRVAAIPLDAPPCALNQRVAKISPKQSVISNRFLILYLSSMAFRLNLESKAHGAAQLNVSPKELAACQIPLPPMEEQQAIVDKLDRAFAGLETARANAEANLENAKELFQSALTAAFENASTIEAGWSSDTIHNVCDHFTDGNWIETKDQSPAGIRLIQTGNIGQAEFKSRLDKARFISEDTFEALGCTEVLSGDLLVSRLPDPVGRCAVVPDLDTKAITAVDCSILRLDQSRIAPQFFVYHSLSRSYLREVDQACTGTTRRRISRKNLGKVRVPVPPLHEQQAIIEKLDNLKDETDRLQQEYARQLSDLDELKQSLLQKAFAGELT